MTCHTTSTVNLWEKHRWNSKPETWKAAFLSHAFPTRTPKPWFFFPTELNNILLISFPTSCWLYAMSYSNCHTTVTKSARVTAPNWAPIVAVKTPILNLWQLGHLWHSHKIKKASLMSHPSCLETCLQQPHNWARNIINSPKASAAQKAVNHLTMEHHASKRKALKTESNRRRKVSCCAVSYHTTIMIRIIIMTTWYHTCGNKCKCYASICFRTYECQ